METMQIRLGTSVLVAFAAAAAGQSNHAELARFFGEWREFQHPVVIDGVPDYSAVAMKRQYAALPQWRKRLESFDISGWTTAEKIDYNLIRAEMNGLEFDHRVLRPWAKAPFFYRTVFDSESDTPLHEGPHVYGALDLWRYKLPLSPADAKVVLGSLVAIPKLLAQAKVNLTEPSRDLWTLGIWYKQGEAQTLATLAEATAGSNPDVSAAAKAAAAAVEDFRSWLAAGLASAPAGKPLGVTEYNWYLKNVQLTAQTWQSLMQSMERELARSLASLQLVRNRNRALPELRLPSSLGELNRRNDEAIEAFLSFLKKQEIFTVPDYMNFDRLRPVSRLLPADSLDFFSNIEYRDSLPMKCHSIHWLEKQRLDHEPHPSVIRSSRPLYNIWSGRSEGFATAWEEAMMLAGLLDARPRAQELIHIMTAVRAIRGIADLKYHSGEFTLAQAMQYVVDATPNGWFNPKGETLWVDLGIYAHQPGYGTTYLAGKLDFDRIIADVAAAQPGRFRMKTFMDDFFSKGVIPMSLIRWEMTGKTDEAAALGLRF